MQKVVMDTDIVIDFLRTGNGPFLHLLELQEKEKIEMYISSVTVMELFAGEMKKKQIDILGSLITVFTIIPFETRLAQFCGELKRGKKLDVLLADFIIGTTAIYLNAKLATRNKRHFSQLSGIRFFET